MNNGPGTRILLPIYVGVTFLLLGLGDRMASGNDSVQLSWQEQTLLPDSLGVAGPFAGVHNSALIVAGGANFRQPVWENEKAWHAQIHVLTKADGQIQWHDGGQLSRPVAYGATVSTPDGIVCIGGNDSSKTFDDVFLLQWDPVTRKVTEIEFPSLPQSCAYGSAAFIGRKIFLAGGQSELSLDSAMSNFWSLDLSKRNEPEEFQWQDLPSFPGPTRAFNLTVSQHNGYNDCVYVISGRRQASADANDVEFLKDVWEYNPTTREWRRRNDAPSCLMAGTGIGFGQSHIFVLGGADGSLFFAAMS